MFFYPLGNAICCFYCRWVFWHFVRFFYYWTLLFLLPRIAFLFFSFAFFITAAAFLMALYSVFRSHGFSSSMLLRCFVRFIIVIPLFFFSHCFFLSLKISLLYPCVAVSLLLQLLYWYPYAASNVMQKHIITILERVKNRRYTRTFGRDGKTHFQGNYAAINESPSPCVPKLAQIASFNPRNACTLALDPFYDL